MMFRLTSQRIGNKCFSRCSNGRYILVKSSKSQDLVRSLQARVDRFTTVQSLTGLSFLRRNPFTGQVIIAIVKSSVADFLVQKQIEKREVIDYRRNLLFIAFGGVYLGVFQWYVYVVGFKRIFPGLQQFCNQSFREKLRNSKGLKQLFGQIALDFVFIQPFIFFPTFYLFSSFTNPPDGAKSRVQQALRNWKSNFIEDNVGMCAFWLPMDIIIYSVPLWLRLPANHGISFIWVCIMSFFRGDIEEEVSKSEA